jgi:hypothetical protein
MKMIPVEAVVDATMQQITRHGGALEIELVNL